MRRIDSRRPPARGFTLIEALLSVALLAALLAALNLFVFSMGEIWGRNREDRLFEQHTRAVTRHLEDLLRRAALAPAPALPPRVATAPALAASAPLLTFDLPEGDRTLPWPGAPLPDVRCALEAVPQQGLVLHWQSRWEVEFEKVAPRRTVLSPLVTRVEYAYYGDGRWQVDLAPRRDKRGAWAMPARIHLRFEHRGRIADAVVPVPRRAGLLAAY
ncbi:MAG TPA: prepilin-type N-terminal cleavage/methylation domain-containing protein [Opitutaceae bacterium]|nr:prepilin-type N-terminal cleavage/methylation domain-containing protein [Opitutaceae bacterium]